MWIPLKFITERVPWACHPEIPATAQPMTQVMQKKTSIAGNQSYLIDH